MTSGHAIRRLIRPVRTTLRFIVGRLVLLWHVTKNCFRPECWGENLQNETKHLLFGALAGFYINAGGLNWLFLIPLLIFLMTLRLPGVVRIGSLFVIISVAIVLWNHHEVWGWLLIIPAWQAFSELAKAVSTIKRSVSEMEFLRVKLANAAYHSALEELNWDTFIASLPKPLAEWLHTVNTGFEKTLTESYSDDGLVSQFGFNTSPIRCFVHRQTEASPPQSASHAIYSCLSPSYIVINKPIEEWRGLALFEVLHEVFHIVGTGRLIRDNRFTGRAHIIIAYLISFSILPKLTRITFESLSWSAFGPASFVFVFVLGVLSLRGRFRNMDINNHGASEARASLGALSQIEGLEEACRTCERVIAIRKRAAQQRFLMENQAGNTDGNEFTSLLARFEELWNAAMIKLGFHTTIGAPVDRHEAYWLSRALAAARASNNVPRFEYFATLPAGGFHDFPAYILMLGWAIASPLPGPIVWWIIGAISFAVLLFSTALDRDFQISRAGIDRALGSIPRR